MPLWINVKMLAVEVDFDIHYIDLVSIALEGFLEAS